MMIVASIQKYTRSSSENKITVCFGFVTEDHRPFVIVSKPLHLRGFSSLSLALQHIRGNYVTGTDREGEQKRHDR